MANDVHYIERDTGTNAGFWAVIAVLIVLFALLFFGPNLFDRNNNDATDINIRGNIETPGGSSGPQ
jgi:hypothetical protein